MKTYMELLIWELMSSASFAASDEGVITEVHTDEAGNISVKLDGGFPNSVAASECSTYGGWAGSARQLIAHSKQRC